MRPPLLEPPASIFLAGVVQILLLLGLFFALVYHVAELTLFCLVLLCLGLGTYLWSRASLQRVDCRITVNRKRLFPGDRLRVGIRATNAKALPLLLKVDLYAPRAITGADAGQWISREAGLLWFQRAEFAHTVFPCRRGVFDLGPPTIRGGDLFGFFFRESTLPDRFEVVVYPRIANIRPMPAPKREFFGIPGAKSPVEDPVYVFGTRDYQPGRPARGIHWKASARHNRLQEKLCEPAEQEKVLILLDVAGFDPAMEGPDFENCLEVIAAQVLHMDRRGTAMGLATNGQLTGGGPRILPISRSPLQTAALLEALARVQAGRAGAVTDILSQGYRIPWGVSALYFARNADARTRAAALFFRRLNIPVRMVLAHGGGGAADRDDPPGPTPLYLDDIQIVERRKK